MNYTIRNLLIATALMVFGIVLTTSFINKERKSLSRGKQEITVYVAKKEIPPGTPAKNLEEGGFLDTKDMLREDAPPSAITELSDLTKPKLTSNDTVYEGDVITLRAFDKQASLAAPNSIKGNQRLVSVAFNSANTVGNLVRPGDRIDIIATRQLQATGQGGGQTFQTWYVARDVLVVETPESLTPSAEGEAPEAKAPEADGDGQVYVLRVTDRNFADVWHAQSMADDYKLSMALRPASGDTETPTDPLLGTLYLDDSGVEPPAIKGTPGETQFGPNAAQL